MKWGVVCLILVAGCRIESVVPPGADSTAAASQTTGSDSTVTSQHFLGLRTAKYTTTDLAAAKAWYIEATGVQPYFDEPFYVGFNIGGFELGIVPEESASGGRAESGVAYWGVTDIEAEWQRLIALGATPHEPVQDVGGDILIGSLHDPFGNVLGIIQNPHFGQ